MEFLTDTQPSLFFLVIVLCIIVGLCFGSFLNVVIYRLPVMLERQWQAQARDFLDLPSQASGGSVGVFNLAYPRSACPVCGAGIRAWQNIPVISYLLLKGKCHSCKTSISIRYPLVEMLTGVLTLALLFKWGFNYQLLAMLLLTYISIALAGIDIDHRLLPDDLTLPLVWCGLIVNSQSLFVSLPESLWGAVLGYGVLWLVFWLFKIVTGKEGMGYGDFKLLSAYGAWFGWTILPNTILLASLVGTLVGGLYIWKKGYSSQMPIPFGPFIILAGWLTAVYPQQFTLINYFR